MLPGSAPPPSQDAIWNWFQNEGAHSFSGSRARLAWLARRVRARLVGRAAVLDIGVGDGTFERLADELGLEVHCVDPNERALARVRDQLALGGRARVGRAEDLPFQDASFAAAVASEVFEHLDDARLTRALAELARVLEPRGWLFGTVPARERLAASQVVCPQCSHRFHRWGHVQSFARDELGARLAAGGFELVELHERPFPCFGELNWKGKLGGALRLALWRLGSHGRDEFLAFVARRRG